MTDKEILGQILARLHVVEAILLRGISEPQLRAILLEAKKAYSEARDRSEDIDGQQMNQRILDAVQRLLENL